MAEGKKSFVMYAEYLEYFEILTPDQRSQAIMWILKYVNDQNPAPPEDPLVRGLLMPIQKQLKRDLQRWETKRSKAAEAGRLGGLARAENAKKGAAIEADQANAKNANQTAAKDSSDSSDKRSEADQGVNVNVNANVNVNDNVKKKESSAEGKPSRHDPSEEENCPKDDCPTFQEFWDKYDYKKDRPKAEKAWNRLSKADKKAAFEAVDAYVASTSKSPNDKKTLRKYPQGWINGRRWEDEIESGLTSAGNKADEKPWWNSKRSVL